VIADLVAEDLPPRPAVHILDVGLGHGENAEALRARGFAVTGVEISEALVAEYGPRARRLGIGLVCADACKLPFGDDSFDGAILIEVFEHVPDPAQVLSEIHRTLRPGGRLWIAVPTHYTEAIYWRVHPGYAANAGHVARYRREQVDHLLRTAGFRVIAVETRNLIPALSWMLHALLRSRSDDTGRIHQHRWADWIVLAVVAPFKLLPGLNVLYGWASRRFGKSWYFRCAKA
jgi:SAM-dependent methyltransferase